jgi:hypothetical protein
MAEDICENFLDNSAGKWKYLYKTSPAKRIARKHADRNRNAVKFDI